MEENRYHQLGLQNSLFRHCNYPSACRELALILKLSYSKFPKVLQSVIFQDVLTAFRLLPRMQTQLAISAANALLQSVESGRLPKQKKAVAVTEFKHAMVAHKRLTKAFRSEEDLVELPQDVLVHIFSFLDIQSLVSASQVCRSWNVASSDNQLWHLIYTLFFSSIIFNNNPYGGFSQSLDWRSNFKKAYHNNGMKLLTFSRGLCSHCHTIIWVNDMGNDRPSCRYHRIKPISTRQIVEYIDGGYASSDSDSDSDSYDECFSKLWAYPKSGFCS